MTTKEKCKQVIENLREIAERYQMSDVDKQAIIEPVSDAYKELDESYRIQNTFEGVILKELGQKTFNKLAEMAIKKQGEHLQKVLFEGDSDHLGKEWYDLPDE